ncbi:MAG: nucleotidyl transferase AbiEii/AbiGii toxin family protein [Bacteroidota bacterium]|nr:nucleotidyl transferase AbiEii/AbiGii toxin family protein [Bacteroidota bacterium]
MSNLLKIPFSKIRDEGSHKEIFQALERGFIKFGIDFYLVGATARDVWMRGVHDLPPKRATSDIDFGIMIKDINTFDDLKSYLIDVEGFVPYKENEFVLIWKDKTQVDLIPFGDLEREGIVTVKGTGFTSMNVEGFKEVYEQASEEIITEDQRFKVCTLPGIVILKLIAWDDRPEVRRDDIDDIAEIIKNYFHLNDEVIFEQHSDLFTDDTELDEIASQFLGREIGKIVSGNPKLVERIKGILENGLNDNNNLAELYASESDETIEYSKSLISHIMKGIEEVTSESK